MKNKLFVFNISQASL